MAKVVAPAIGMDASGKFGNTLVWAKWKGRVYVRQLVKPKNPKSDAQIGVRAGMKWNGPAWRALTAANQATWDAPANAAQYTPFNAYSKQTQNNLGNNKGPQTEYDMAETTVAGDAASFAASVSGKSVTFTWTDDTGADAYANLIHMNGSTGFTPSRANLRGIVAQGVQSFTVEGLKAGTYYADLIVGSTSGKLGTAVGEISFTIT